MNDIREETDAAIVQVREIRKPNSEFFRYIGDATIENVRSVFGNNLGSFLHGLCPVLNLSHPDLGDVISNRHADQIMEAIEVAKFASRKGFHLLDFSKMLKVEMKDIEPKIRLLKMCARLLQKGERDAARNIKRTQTIDLSHAYKKCADDNIPSNFDLYIRHSMVYKTEIEKCEKQAEHFKRLGCDSMYAEIQKSLDAFQEIFDDAHYGFRRITMTLVALILKKMHISSSHFPAASAYPVHVLHLPERINNVINVLEKFPEVGGNPVFDYYIVVSPNLDTPDNLSESIANKTICPVLLGEKDGKCYFITIF